MQPHIVLRLVSPDVSSALAAGLQVIVQDKWKDGARNTMESGGRKIGENKLLSKRRGAGLRLSHIRISVSSAESRPADGCTGFPVLVASCCDAGQDSTVAFVVHEGSCLAHAKFALRTVVAWQ